MYKLDKYHQYDSKNPTFSSSLLEQINKSLKNNTKNDLEEDLTFFKTTKVSKKTHEDKMSTLRRASLVEKWMEKKGTDKVVTKKCKVKSCNTMLEEFDVQDSTLFFSNTATTSTSSSSSEAEYSAYTHPRHKQQQQKPWVTCFTPQMPKSIKTRPIKVHVESKTNNVVKEDQLSKSRSKAVKIYSNFKNLKQPISPGVRLTSFINSLFSKDINNKTNNDKKRVNHKNVDIISKSETPKNLKTSYSTCTTPTSYSRSCFNNNKGKRFQDDGIKRTVRFFPVSVIVDEDSRPCGEKSLFDQGCDRRFTSKFAKSLSRRYDELKILNELEKECDKNNNRKIEEVALDLLSGYCWDSRLGRKSSNNDQCDEDGSNRDVNDDQSVDNYEDEDDGLSCSSSDLFELDHLSLIGNELPVYETTRLDPKIH